MHVTILLNIKLIEMPFGKKKKDCGCYSCNCVGSKRQMRKERRAHNKAARQTFREDHPGALKRLFGAYKIKNK